jgi:hypothetical protein
MKRFVTRALIVVVAILGIVFVQVAPASANTSKKLVSNLTEMWTTLLETPSAQNPFGTGGAAFACIDLGGHTVAPFAGGEEFSCTVKPGTKLFVAGISTECSDIPGDDNPEGDPPFTEEQLRACAVDADGEVAPAVSLDGRSVPLTGVVTPLLNIVLPEGNVFDSANNPVPGGTTGQSVAHGWVALLNPLPPGTHTIKITDNNGVLVNTTTIVVQPGH